MSMSMHSAISRPCSAVAGGRPSTAGRRRPGTARVSVQKDDTVSSVNPSPLGPANVANVKGSQSGANGHATATLISEGLSSSKLHALTGAKDLESVTSLTVIVDTTECSLGQFSTLLPSLQKLDISNSVLTSIRDLGTGFNCLVNLQLTNCQLRDLDGISTIRTLEELHAPHNAVSDIAPIAQLDQLRCLDLSFNQISDAEQLDFLALCLHLKAVCFQGNPFHEDSGASDHSCPKSIAYLTAIREAIPTVDTLDGCPISSYEEMHRCEANDQASASTITTTVQGVVARGERLVRPHTAGAASAVARRRTLDMYATVRRPSLPHDTDVDSDPVMRASCSHGTARSDDVASLRMGRGDKGALMASGEVFQRSPLHALRARRQSSGDFNDHVASDAPETAPLVSGGEKLDNATCKGMHSSQASDVPSTSRGCRADTCIQTASDVRHHRSTGTVDAPSFMGTDPELDALMESVGIAPVGAVDDNDDDVFGTSTSIDAVFEDLRQWRSTFDAHTPGLPASSPDHRKITEGTGAGSSDRTVKTPRPPPGPRPRPPPGPPRSNSGNGRDVTRRRSFSRRPRTTSAGARSSLDFESSAGTPLTRPHPPPPRKVGS
eukprot:m.286345 g.286345  ORF g.286345 m.286345 type:complete len:607 (+) comp19926_c0_seq2:330-2150(+)